MFVVTAISFLVFVLVWLQLRFIIIIIIFFKTLLPPIYIRCLVVLCKIYAKS